MKKVVFILRSMPICKFGLFWTLVTLICSQLAGQKVFFSGPNEENQNIVYDSEWYLKGTWHTNGFYIQYAKGDILSIRKTKYFTAGFGTIQHPKEQRQSNDFGFFVNDIQDFKPFKFGKTNRLYVLKGGLGTKHHLSIKAREKNVRISVQYEYGLNLGLLRPYYVRVNSSESVNTVRLEDIKHSEETASVFLDLTRIYGGTGIRRGWDEIKFRPGAYVDVAANFEFGQNDSRINALQLGIVLDAYANKIELMATENSQSIFLNFYAAFAFGSRN